MPSDTNKTVIINLALASIKQRLITSPDDGSLAARTANLFYDRARRETLRAADWHWAGLRQPLTLLGSQDNAIANPTVPSAQDVAPQYRFLYAYPSNCIRVRKLFNAQLPLQPGPYDQYSDRSQNSLWGKQTRFEELRSPVTNLRALATNCEFAWAEVTVDITDESQFDDSFTMGFSFVLAQYLAMPLTADKELVDLAVKVANMKMGEAARKNGGEGTEFTPRYSSYEAVRE